MCKLNKNASTDISSHCLSSEAGKHTEIYSVISFNFPINQIPTHKGLSSAPTLVVLHNFICSILFNVMQSVKKVETMRGGLRKEHAEKEEQPRERLAMREDQLRKEHGEKEDQLREKLTEKEDQLRERLAEKEDQLRERLAEKDAYINSHLNEISYLQQQLKVTPIISILITRHSDFLPAGRDECRKSTAVQAASRATGG